MSNLDARPLEQTCAKGASATDPAAAVEVLEARAVPLGGTRAGTVAMTVRRTIPQRARSLVGAWCFCDHYGPDDVTAGPGMQVPPHPHTGLQTVTWLFAGEILHRDSVGSRVMVRPGQLNLMTAGHGVSHSEETPAGSTAPLLHGVQLWVALPASMLGAAPAFEHHEDLPVVEVPGARAHVLVGSLALHAPDGTVTGTSPATVHTPLLGAQIDLEPGTTVEIAADPAFEHAVLVDTGSVHVEGTPVARDALAYVAPGRDRIVIGVGEDGPGRIVLLGGEPFDEQIVMWWNFVGRSHEDVVAARTAWQAGLVVTEGGPHGIARVPNPGPHPASPVANPGPHPASPVANPGPRPASPVANPGPHRGGTAYAPDAADGRFGEVVGYAGGPLPAPVLPDVRLRPRTRPS